MVCLLDIFRILVCFFKVAQLPRGLCKLKVKRGYSRDMGVLGVFMIEALKGALWGIEAFY
jgi:hypothetical protein